MISIIVVRHRKYVFYTPTNTFHSYIRKFAFFTNKLCNVKLPPYNTHIFGGVTINDIFIIYYPIYVSKVFIQGIFTLYVVILQQKKKKKTQIDISLIFILSFMTYMKFNIHTIYIHMTWIECNIIKICEKYYKWSTSLICFACFGCVWICISLAFLESFIILNISHKNSLWKEIILIHLFGLSHATKLKWFPYIDA